MKKYQIILCLALLLSTASMAQGISIKETFDGSTELEWPEYSEKDGSALLQDGCFKLTCLSKKLLKKPASVSVMLPIQVDQDFTIESTVVAKKLSSMAAFSFGVGANTVSLAAGKLFDLDSYKFTKIKLKGGKDVTVTLRFEYRNGESSLYVNNMRVKTFYHPVAIPSCAFATTSELSIQSFRVRQE